MKREMLRMQRLTKQEVENLTDREVKVACERIKRDYSFGLLSDKVTPLENTQLLEEELRERG
ncbi:MAG: hypothetical protein KKH73_05520, partial [Actinobacteria bacterium]|nr:hypothetical protein [Actinomycetota bacterium]